MIIYFGEHSAKQYIKGKPIKFGYKLWCLITNLGYLIHCDPLHKKWSFPLRISSLNGKDYFSCSDPYSGKDNHNAKLVFGRSVVARLVNPLSANPTKWLNTLKQFFANLPTNCSSVFGHFVGLALKGLTSHQAKFHLTRYLTIFIYVLLCQIICLKMESVAQAH